MLCNFPSSTVTAKTKLYELYDPLEITQNAAQAESKFEIQITQNALLTESKFEIQIKIESKLKTRSLGNLSNQLFVHQHNKRISILTTVVRTPHSIMEHKTITIKELERMQLILNDQWRSSKINANVKQEHYGEVIKRTHIAHSIKPEDHHW